MDCSPKNVAVVFTFYLLTRGGSTVPLILVSPLPLLQKIYSGGYKLLWQPHKQDIIPLSSHVVWQRRLVDTLGFYFS